MYSKLYEGFSPEQLKSEQARLEVLIKEKSERLKDAKGEDKSFLEKVIAARAAKLAVVKSLIPADKADTKSK